MPKLPKAPELPKLANAKNLKNTINAENLKKAANMAQAAQAATAGGNLSPRIPRLFSLENVGASAWFPTHALLAARALYFVAFLGMLGMAAKRKLWGAMVAPGLGALVALLLAATSALQIGGKVTGKFPQVKTFAQVVGVVYQTLASGALFVVPLFVALFVTRRTHVLSFVANVLPAGIFLIDNLFLGAQVRFRVLLIPLPVVVELVAGFLPLLRKKKQFGEHFSWILAGTIVWTFLSAILALYLTRITSCIKNQSEEEEDTEEFEAMEGNEEVSAA